MSLLPKQPGPRPHRCALSKILLSYRRELGSRRVSFLASRILLSHSAAEPAALCSRVTNPQTGRRAKRLVAREAPAILHLFALITRESGNPVSQYHRGSKAVECCSQDGFK